MRYTIFLIILCCTALLIGCLESWFMLDETCRLPQWFLDEAVEVRENYEVKLAYYINRKGRSAIFTLIDDRGKKVRRIKAKQYGSSPVFIDNNGFVKEYNRQYPIYELVEYNGLREVIVHQQSKDNDFCLLDDDAVSQKIEKFFGLLK